MNPWKILGVDRDASAEEIRAAWRVRAAQHHPDAGGNARKFRQVMQAYEQLSRPDPDTGSPANPDGNASYPSAPFSANESFHFVPPPRNYGRTGYGRYGGMTLPVRRLAAIWILIIIGLIVWLVLTLVF